MNKFFLIGVFLITSLGFSQNHGAIKGNVLDKEMQNEPLLFANVQLKEANKKTETNFHGNFEFNNLEIGDYTLVVSYVGYENVELPIVVEADKVTRINFGMSAKQIDFDTILSAETTSKENSTSLSSERLPRE